MSLVCRICSGCFGQDMSLSVFWILQFFTHPYLLIYWSQQGVSPFTPILCMPQQIQGPNMRYVVRNVRHHRWLCWNHGESQLWFRASLEMKVCFAGLSGKHSRSCFHLFSLLSIENCTMMIFFVCFTHLLVMTLQGRKALMYRIWERHWLKSFVKADGLQRWHHGRISPRRHDDKRWSSKRQWRGRERMRTWK